MVEHENEGLPDFLNATEEELELFFPVWVNWLALDRKFLPSQIMAEPERLLSVIMELDGVYETIKAQLSKEKQSD